MKDGGRGHYQELKELLRADVLRSRKRFTWRRILFRCWRAPGNRFVVWWRIANCLYLQGGGCRKLVARRIHRSLVSKYSTDIMLGAKIGGGLRIAHFAGVVIFPNVVIGENLFIRQNTTIGAKGESVDRLIVIGDNVSIGANSCIIGDKLTIGDNVVIGAMSFINKDVPSGCTVYTKTTNVVKLQHDHSQNNAETSA
ncbi:serine O-acetyltransferase [Kluyvera ascorbata]